jgi:SAM-dependent methyltransferase
VTGILSAHRSAIDSHSVGRRWFSPASYGLVTATERAIESGATGDLLDIGCGSMPYRSVVEAQGASYSGVDIEARTEGVQMIKSATDMSSLDGASFDSVLCSEVLEHIAEPQRALQEIGRVVRPGGSLILTVPFLGRLHEEPVDFFRYTEHGLRSLLEKAGFEIESIEITGSIFSLLGHQVSSAFVVGAWVPGLKWIALALNATAVVGPARLADALLGPLRRKLPLGYVVIARRTT